VGNSPSILFQHMHMAFRIHPLVSSR
jgi:hypothetical protein